MNQPLLRHALQATACVFLTWAAVHLAFVASDAAATRSNMVTMVEVESKRLHAGLDLFLFVLLAPAVFVATRRTFGRRAIAVSFASAIGAALLAVAMGYYVRLALLGRLPKWLATREYAY